VKILDVSPRVAYPPERGSAVRAFHLLRHLGRRHEVRQFSQAQWRDERFGRLSEDVRLSPSFSEYRWVDRAASLVSEISERSWVRAPLLSGAALWLRRPRVLERLFSWADVTLVEFPWQFDFCRLRARGPVVLASHNIEALKFLEYRSASGLPARHGAWLRFIERAEAGAASRADLILAVKHEDRQAFVERYRVDAARVAVVPNGADIETYRPVAAEARLAARRSLGLPDRPVVLFAGSDVPPNRAALRWIHLLAALTDRFTFLVVGPVSRRMTEGHLIATGRVSDISACFRAADMFVCPVRFGGGTKIKLLEALAAGLPTVASEESIHGLDVRNEEHLLIEGPDEKAWITALDRLADDGALAERLGRSAAAHVALHHDWARIADDLERVLVRLVETGAARGHLRKRNPD
jgi:glycosyltransferase involved in cell wall biosynthesis